MNLRFRFLTLLLLAITFSLPALAYNPKLKPGINEGTGAGINEGADTRLPLGLPFQYTDGSSYGGGNGDSNADPARIVYSFELTEDIGPASLRQTHTALEQARSMNAACVLIRINSYSGAMEAAQQIRDELLAFDRPIIIYVEDKAISAAALISLAGDSLYMRKGANISQVAENAQIHSRSGNKTTTKHTVVTQPKKQKSQLAAQSSGNATTATSAVISSTEAVRQHVANAEAADVKEVLARAGLDQYQLVYYTPGFFEQVIDLLMKPWASLALIFFIAFGIRLQRSLAFPGPATFFLLVILSLFAVPMYQGGLASGTELLLLVPPVIFNITGPLKNHRNQLVRLLPLAMLLLVLTLCRSGSVFATTVSTFGLSLLFTGITFCAGWLLPSAFKKMRTVLQLRFVSPERKTTVAVS